MAEFQKVLREKASLEEPDFAALQLNQPVVRLVPATDKREVAVTGLVNINASAEEFLRLYRDSMMRKNNAAILEIGSFGHEPTLGNQAWDWGFSLVPESSLTPQVLIGLGIGRDPTSGTNPVSGAACGETASGRELADRPSQPVAPARTDRLTRRSKSRRCHACFNPGRRPCEESPSSDTTA